jgi:hypothetical protein
MANYAFHDYEASKVLSANGLGDWVFPSFPKREVDYAIATHYHPYVDALIEQLNVSGLAALLDASYHKTLTKPLAGCFAHEGWLRCRGHGGLRSVSSPSAGGSGQP